MRARLDRLAKCDSEQAGAEQHKAGCGYCEESIGHEVMIAHGTPAARLVTVSIVPRPLEQNDMPRSAVKRISRCSENWNLTDVLKQQGPGPAGPTPVTRGRGPDFRVVHRKASYANCCPRCCPGWAAIQK